VNIFISYSRDDRTLIADLVDRLHSESPHTIWFDRRLVGADLWWRVILSEIERSDCFVIALTPRSAESIYCAAEMHYALALNKPVLPLLLKPCEIHPVLRPIQFTDIMNISLDLALARVLNVLGRVEVRALRGEFPPTTPLPPRPSQPEARAPIHVFEVLAAAEEAIAASDLTSAEKLFQQVIKVDPEGAGKIAIERMAETRRDFERTAAYDKIIALESTANEATLRAAWRAYRALFGLTYDPNGYAQQFPSERTPAEGILKRPVPVSLIETAIGTTAGAKTLPPHLVETRSSLDGRTKAMLVLRRSDKTRPKPLLSSDTIPFPPEHSLPRWVPIIVAVGLVGVLFLLFILSQT